MPATTSPTDDLATLSAADLAQLVRELRSANESLRAASGAPPGAAQSLLDDQLRRTSLLTQLAIEFREALEPAQIVEQTLRALAANLVVAGASIILVGPNRSIELASAIGEGGVQPIAGELARGIVEHGLAGWVLRHGSSVALSDVARDRRWLQFSEQHRSGSVIVIPIRQTGAILGALTAHRATAHAFSSHDLILLEGVAAQLGVALSAVRHQASERQRRDQAMALLAMSQFLTAERSPAELADMLHEKSVSVFGAGWGMLFLSSGEGEEAALRVVLPDGLAAESEPVAYASGAAQLAWAGQRIVTTAPAPDQTCVALPLINHGATIGSFVLLHAGQGGFSANLWSLLTVFTHVVAAACASMQLVRRLTEQSQALEHLVAQRTRQMQRSRDALRVVFDSLPDGIVLIDADERVAAANQVFCAEIIGQRPSALVGQSYAQVWQLLERRAEVKVKLLPSDETGRQRMLVRWGAPGQEAAFLVERMPAGGDDRRIDQHLEFWRRADPTLA